VLLSWFLELGITFGQQITPRLTASHETDAATVVADCVGENPL
jgi:hypothetical protein